MPLDQVHSRVQIARLRTAVGALVFAGGAVSFGGWAFDAPGLTDWFRLGVSIQPNPSVLLVLAGGALILVDRGIQHAVAALGAIIAAVGALTLSQYIVGVDFGINHPLTFGRAWGQATTVSPGRMGPPASTSFTLIGLALLLLGSRGGSPRVRRVVPMLGVGVSLIALFSIVGYLVDARPLYTVPWLTAIALQTGLMLFTTAAGILMCVPERHPLRLLLSDSNAGALARRMFPALLVLPPVLGWLRTKGETLGYFDSGTGRAMLIVTIIMLGAGLLWSALFALARHEAADRERAKAALREQRLVAESLRDADQRKNEFLAILAHELRGPLAPLRNALELLKRAGGDALLLERTRGIMDRQLGHLARLVEDLLDVSRITRDRIEIRKEFVELGSLLEACVETCRPAAEEQGQLLSLALPPEPIRVEADPVRLTQVFNNILHNASKYAGRGGHIACVAGTDGAEAMVRIRDTGIGIEPDKLESVFEMFTQLDPGENRARGGLGIGLTLARRLVELHGGSIAAQSAGRGQGSEFTVRLPVPVEAALQHASGNARASGPPPSCRFLVVDDNPDATGSLCMLLKFSGHETASAHGGPEALEVGARFHPDVVVLDIGLPGLDGYETCRRIREQPWGKQALIIALTGWGQDTDRERSRAAGFDHHFVKPVEFQELLALVGSRVTQQPAA